MATSGGSTHRDLFRLYVQQRTLNSDAVSECVDGFSVKPSDRQKCGDVLGPHIPTPRRSGGYEDVWVVRSQGGLL